MNSNILKIINNGRPNVVVDISWVFYRSFYVFSPDKFRTSQGILTDISLDLFKVYEHLLD